MSAVLQVADQKLGAEEICTLLTSPQVLPHLLRELIIEQVTNSVDCTTAELEIAFREMSQEPQYRHLPPAHVERLIPRQLKLNKFKESTWGTQVEAEFRQHQERYDQVLFSLVQTDNLEIVQELYFRLREGEASFGELATQYSQGPEARTNGLVGPLELFNLHPKLSHMLRISQPGQVSPPFRVDQWVVIVRLERYLPAKFDDKLRQRLIDQQFEAWMQQAIAQHANSVKLPELADLPTIDLQKQATIEPRRSEATARPRLAPAALPTAGTTSEAVDVSPSEPPQEPLESPFVDEVPVESDSALIAEPQPVNETIPFQLPNRTDTDESEVRVPRFRDVALLALIPVVLGGWSVAAFMGWSPKALLGNHPDGADHLDTRTPELAIAPDAETVSGESVANLLPEEVTTPFHTAVNHANEAAALIPRVASPADWDKIAQEWRQAVDLMAVVPSDHPKYALAQAKVEEYQGYLNYAEQQASDPNYAFRLAVRHAQAAATTSQQAQGTQKWGLAVRAWDDAIASMQSVPVESDHYGLAQAKVLEYQGYREIVQSLNNLGPVATQEVSQDLNIGYSAAISPDAIAPASQDPVSKDLNIGYGAEISP